jgi:hypothetical protein
LKDFDELLWNGCTNHNKLSVIAHINSDYGLSEASYNRIIKWTISILPK